MVRMQDVADRANVSIATVSFVVNGTKRVSESTRTRVETAMSELGFTRNVVARALASRRSRLIALLFPALDTRGNWSALEFVHGASAGAAERDHHLILWPVANDPVELREYLDGRLVDGVLAMEVQLEDPRVPVLEATETPFVLIGRTADTGGYAFVDIDFERSTAAALEHLRGVGHRRIALVLEQPGALGPSAYGPPVRVERQYRQIMAEHGARPAVVLCERQPAAGADAATRLLQDHPDVTAVVIMNDEAAPGVLRSLRAAGRSVPDDVSVLGLSMASRMAAVCEPVVDHFAPPGFELGRAAALALIDRLEDSTVPPIRTLLACTYSRGDSVAPPRGASWS
jgi:DNA-binding LacI/PurR family transcriptional regulator